MRSRWSLALASFAPALAFVYAGYERRWAGDDGFINLRVVSQLMDGNGFVYNAGERTEAVTSAGWVLLLWLLGELGLNLDSAAWIVSLAFSGVGLFMATRASALITAPANNDDDNAIFLPLGALAYAAIPVAWDYETSALENGIGLAYLGLTFWFMARVVRGMASRHAAIGAFMGLAPLVRPDFVLYAAPLGLVLLYVTEGTRARLRVLACAAAPGLAFQIFRMGYFAALVPNTAIAKEAFAARWDQGLLYFSNTFDVYQLMYPLAIVTLAILVMLVLLVRDSRWLHALVPASLAFSGAVHILYVVRLGGDFMHGRMFLPGLFAVFSAAALLRVRLSSWPARIGSVVAFSLVSTWAFYCARDMRPEKFVHEILDERRWWSETAEEANPTHLHQFKKHRFYKSTMDVKNMFAAGCPGGLKSLGDNIGDHCRRVTWLDPMDGRLSDHPNDVLLPLANDVTAPQIVGVYAFRPLGISGRLMGLRVNLTDSFGLADPLASRIELNTRGRPGHEKDFTTVWFAAKYVAPGATRDPRVLDAKRALECGLLRRLHRATHLPLTVSRFFTNIPLSFKLHGLRVPQDAKQAAKKFCGS